MKKENRKHSRARKKYNKGTKTGGQMYKRTEQKKGGQKKNK